MLSLLPLAPPPLPGHHRGGRCDMPSLPRETARVTEVPAASPAHALAHFEALLSFETDCWDVHAAVTGGRPDFVLLDVRAPDSYAAGHLPGAASLPHGRINERNLAAFPADALFVVYCNG